MAAAAAVSSAAHAALVSSFISSSSVALLQPLAQPRAQCSMHMIAAQEGEATTRVARAEVRFSHWYRALLLRCLGSLLSVALGQGRHGVQLVTIFDVHVFHVEEPSLQVVTFTILTDYCVMLLIERPRGACG